MTTIINDPDMTTCDKCDDNTTREEYDDMGVLCRYTEEDGWYAIEDHCVTCGYRCGECECDDGEEDWVYPCEDCGTHIKEGDLNCSECPEKEELQVSSK